MPTLTLLSNNLGGLGESLASIQDLDNLLLPRDCLAAEIISRIIVKPAGLLLLGKTLTYIVTVDGESNVPQTFTFPAKI